MIFVAFQDYLYNTCRIQGISRIGFFLGVGGAAWSGAQIVRDIFLFVLVYSRIRNSYFVLNCDGGKGFP